MDGGTTTTGLPPRRAIPSSKGCGGGRRRPLAAILFGTSRRRFRAARAAATEDHPRFGKRALFFGSYWPDRRASGAGVRTGSLLEAFLGRWGFESCAFACPQRFNEASERLAEELGVRCERCELNRADRLLRLVAEDVDPDVVVFDKFPTEEAYSWIVRRAAPSALRALDMQDSHALRLWRQRRVETTAPSKISDVVASVSPASFEALQRELASIHRSDLTLVCSPAEVDLLTGAWGVPASKVCLAPFFYGKPKPEAGTRPGFDQRRGFVTIGTFLHAPNVDALRWLKQEVWPLVGGQGFELRVFGAHLDTKAGRQVQAMHDPSSGFLVEGFAPDLSVLGEARAVLAPLRYGAGIKTKILDGWSWGTPACTTPIDAESLEDRGGLCVAETAADFARDMVALHEDRDLWERTSRRGEERLAESFDEDRNLGVVGEAMRTKAANLRADREVDFTGQALWHDNLRCTEYFSRWVELKETNHGSS